MTERYDYIICGAGCAGLSLAYYLSLLDLGDRRILLIDQQEKKGNDRTWSFWEKEAGPFESILHASWSQIDFFSSVHSERIPIAPYRYKKIRSAAFYKFVQNKLDKNKNIELVITPIQKIEESDEQVRVITADGEYSGNIVFKSYLEKGFDFGSSQNVLQHFKGWEIETSEDTFDADVATFMDFRIDQKDDLRFMYVLPDSPRKALVEVAIFSNELLVEQDYDEILSSYISKELNIKSYNVLESEFGIIPMTTYPFEKHNTSWVKHIGTAGGWVKASSGYAFTRIQKNAKNLAQAIAEHKSIDKAISGKNRFRNYDKIFLNALLTRKATGDEVFGKMFKNLSSSQIFKFLDEESSFLEDLRIFTGPPTLPFVKAFFEEL
jgi:lycopene beta-cyclase